MTPQSHRAYSCRGFGIGFVGLAVFETLMFLGRRFAWPATLQPIFLGLGLGALVISTIGAFVGRHQLLQRFQLTCPVCFRPLLVPKHPISGMSPTDLVIGTGRCQHCREVVLPE